MDKSKRFKSPIHKQKDPDAFINGDNNQELNEELSLFEKLDKLDRTKSSEKPVHININEHDREAGTALAEINSQFANRKHLFQVLIQKGLETLLAEEKQKQSN